MKKIIIVLASLLLSMQAFSSEKSTSSKSTKAAKSISVKTITGKIVDQSSKDGLAGVEVKVYGTDIKTYTDFNGNFELPDLSTGAQAIVVNYISYQQKVENVFINSEKDNVVDISLNHKD